MEEKFKIKVVWICLFSNPEVRSQLHYNKESLLFLFKRYRIRSLFYDCGIWNTNAIKEFEKNSEVELHVISPHFGIRKLEKFKINEINYYFFKSEDDNIYSFFKERILGKNCSFNKNSLLIRKLIDVINPDIVHLIGAENPYYSSSVIQLDKKYTLLVSLQTLMSDPDFKANYPISDYAYNFRVAIEKKVIKRADYICTTVQKFKDIIIKQIDPIAKFVDLKLAVGETIVKESNQKLYDFVYFSSDISKACDLAIEAFALAYHVNNNITLNIVGNYNSLYKKKIDDRLKELNIFHAVVFSGKLPTHNDVLTQIRLSHFALLPLKIDIISGTIREAMANGIPVVTTITPGTPILNEARESLLLSPIGDFQAMANNMLKLLNDKVYAKNIRENAWQTIKERYNNTDLMKEWILSYKAVINPAME